MQSFKNYLKFTQTKVGLVFACVVPLLFVLIWMTGYQGATERIDQLNAALVNEDGEQGLTVQEHIEQNAPFHVDVLNSSEEAQSLMNEGRYVMVIVIPEGFNETIHSSHSADLTFYVNQGNADIAKTIAEQAAVQISTEVGQGISAELNSAVDKTLEEFLSSPVQVKLVQTNQIGDFATSMLPMILGFITYIAMMTANIQFNISSMMMKRSHPKWQIFWSRQFLLLCISVIVPLIVDGVALLFTDASSPYGQLYIYHVLVFLACACFTQMAFALFGNAGPLFNVAMVPLQLMTAGNIIPADMLTPFYRHIGSFLPAPNGIQGFMRLIYSGSPVSVFAIHLLLICIATWGITLLRVALQKELAPKPTGATGQVQAGAH
ncbi:YhgE/Pip domain-containing protein [Paenibacillus terreus]|uniref:YhgE/Pip domain-containing protein n=1 Tax=Paenibacillus terreus TaxID=1387834 RepID=A0ABV5B686_9BACL